MTQSYPCRQFVKSVNFDNEALLPGLFEYYGFIGATASHANTSAQWTQELYPENVIHEVSNYQLIKLPKLLEDSAAFQCRSAFTFLQAAIEEGYIRDLEYGLLLLGIYTRPNIDEPEERLAHYTGRTAASPFGVWPELTLRCLDCAATL